MEKIKEFLGKDEHLKYLQDRLHEDELSIQKIEDITEEVIKNWISKAFFSNYLLEDLYRVTPTKMNEIKSQLAVHEVTIKLLEPVDYKTIAEEANEAFPEYLPKKTAEGLIIELELLGFCSKYALRLTTGVEKNL